MGVPKRLGIKKMSPSHVRSPIQESEIATKLKGEVTRGSGCGFEKGDIRVKGIMRVEAKTTKNKSYSLKRSTFEGLEDSIVGSNEIPAMIIEFNNEGKPSKELAIVPTYVLEMLCEKLRE